MANTQRQGFRGSGDCPTSSRSGVLHVPCVRVLGAYNEALVSGACCVEFCSWKRRPSSTLYFWWAELQCVGERGFLAPGVGIPGRRSGVSHVSCWALGQSCSATFRSRVLSVLSVAPPDMSLVPFAIPVVGDGAVHAILVRRGRAACPVGRASLHRGGQEAGRPVTIAAGPRRGLLARRACLSLRCQEVDPVRSVLLSWRRGVWPTQRRLRRHDCPAD
jgi:hypothetical protein